MRDSITQKKQQFLDRYNKPRTVEKAASKAISAATQHNSLYSKQIKDKEKFPIREGWTQYLIKLSEKFKVQVSERSYESEILALKDSMNQQFKKYFLEVEHPKYRYAAGFRISHSQKSIGVFLKHLWCMDKIVTPPQCPVDRIILEKAEIKYQKANWAYVNTIEEHRKKIEQLKASSGHSNLAEWELLMF
ncbi:MAG: hypothetical protein RJQ09_16970 [Cyclobacteriaceae bacterium]